MTAFKTYIQGPDPGVEFVTDSFTITEIKTSPVWRQEARAKIELIRKGDLNINIASSTAHSNVTIKVLHAHKCVTDTIQVM